ncbi:putative idc1 protein [Diaporthe ampelina]|uniref:Putative idc1 protein n=1 Tax=Diaporthe ampelina TaxID=1214573 RepID=A0A0G2H442_9PEZI|nr:putative idc1 protein [Diaporthe ampelina]
MSPTAILRYFDPTAATASMFLYAQGNSVVCCHHDTLTIERRFSRHDDEVQILAVDNQSEMGAGRLVVSYDAGQTAIVWDIMSGEEVARFASYEHLTVAAWMRNGNVAFGNTQGNIILFEPTTSEHISARTIDQIAVTALAPSADCRTFAIGYQNGSLLIATLQPRFTILHNLTTSRAPSPIISLSWHASSSRQKSDMLAVQTNDGDLRVWSVSKAYNSADPAKVVRILKKSENCLAGPNWMGWSKNGRIIQHSESETLSWDVRTKHVTFDKIPTLEHTKGLAVYGPGASLFTIAANNTVQQPSRLRHEIARSPEDSRVVDLFKYTRTRLSDVPYKRPPMVDSSRLTNDDLRRQMLCTIFGWTKEAEDLVRDEMSRHPQGTPSRILLAKWLGDIDPDVMAANAENMTSSDWMLLALSGIGGTAAQHKLGLAYVQRLLENGDIHSAVTIMIGMGDQTDAIEVYISHKKFLEALILTCLFFPSVWERQAQIVKKWGEWAVQHGHQQLAIRCFACSGKESDEPWTSPSAQQMTFQSINTAVNPSIPEVLSPPLSPPGLNRGPQRSIAKTSALKLITSFGDQNSKSKFFASNDGGQTPIAAGVTPIAESAISPRAEDMTTAFLRPSSRSAFNTPTTARSQTSNFGRGRLPSIGEMPSDANLRNTAKKSSAQPPPGIDSLTPPIDSPARPGHNAKNSTDDGYAAVGMSLERAATASPMMMKNSHRRKEAPPPSPSPDSLAMLMQSGRRSRNGPRERMPNGLELQLQSLENAMGSDVTSPEQSVTSSTRFHWPTRRRAPPSVTSSTTSASATSSVARGHRGHQGGKSLDDYISSLEAAKTKSRGGSREGRNKTRDSSATRKGGSRERSGDRGPGVQHYYGSEDEEDYRRAKEEQAKFRSKKTLSRGGSKSREPSPGLLMTRESSKPREPQETRSRTPRVEFAVSGSGDLKTIKDERQLKKEAAARELEERRKSLAKRPLAPPIPHPDELSPSFPGMSIPRAPTAFELPSTTFAQHKELPPRSRTAEPEKRSMYAQQPTRPFIGLPATPKAMRLVMEGQKAISPDEPVPPIPTTFAQAESPKSRQNSPQKETSSPQAAEGQGLLTLLPSTVYQPPSRPGIQRCMSAPPEEPVAPQALRGDGKPGHGRLARGQSLRKLSTPDAHSSSKYVRTIDGVMDDNQVGISSHSRRTSNADQIPPPPPPPPPPVLRELQHLATPPPPPPAPLPFAHGGKPPVVYGAPGTIEIVMDNDEPSQPEHGQSVQPLSETAVPVIAPPNPPRGHHRGRSSVDNSIAGRISRATERMRSGSRSRNNSSVVSRTKSPIEGGTAPYESIPMPKGPPVSFHNREIKSPIDGRTMREEFDLSQKMI